MSVRNIVGRIATRKVETSVLCLNNGIRHEMRHGIRAGTTQPRATPSPSQSSKVLTPWRQSSRCHSTQTSECNPCSGETMRLADGRTLGYHVYGAPHGKPVIYLHGVVDTGATLEGKEDALGKKMGIRWIAPDRPGVGKSTFQAGRSILGYSDDISQLAHHLGLKRYYMLGVSGGSAYALACAKVLPREQVRGVGICVGVAPWHAGRGGQPLKTLFNMYMMKYWPRRLLKSTEDIYVPLAREADAAPMANRLRDNLLPYMDAAEADRQMETDAMQSSVRVYRQYYAHGIDAHLADMGLLLRPWGFRIEDVGYEGVRLWYGSADINTPPSMGLYLARRLPKSIYTEYAGETHSSLLIGCHFREILSELTADP